jgi:hypothetical protein
MKDPRIQDFQGQLPLMEWSPNARAMNVKKNHNFMSELAKRIFMRPHLKLATSIVLAKIIIVAFGRKFHDCTMSICHSINVVYLSASTLYSISNVCSY